MITDTGVVLDVGGIGFDVQTGSDAMQILSGKGRGESVHLYTYMNVGREGDIALYGFLSREELRLFKMLITVSGIGPKGALSLLSALSADDLTFAILSGDSKTISKAPGVGKKTAERLVLDLRDKLSKDTGPEGAFSLTGAVSGEETGAGAAGRFGGAAGTGLLSGEGAAADGQSAADQAAADAAEALTALGYARIEAVRAVRDARARLEKDSPETAADTEELLRAALRYLG